MFPNAACVVSLADRLAHRSAVISIDGESYRLKEARERTEARARAAQDPNSCGEEGHGIMSRAPLLPSGRRRGLPFVVPEDWTPEQALAVCELLDLREVCARYLPEIQRLLRAERRQHELPSSKRDPTF